MIYKSLTIKKDKNKSHYHVKYEGERFEFGEKWTSSGTLFYLYHIDRFFILQNVGNQPVAAFDNEQNMLQWLKSNTGVTPIIQQ